MTKLTILLSLIPVFLFSQVTSTLHTVEDKCDSIYVTGFDVEQGLIAVCPCLSCYKDVTTGSMSISVSYGQDGLPSVINVDHEGLVLRVDKFGLQFKGVVVDLDTDYLQFMSRLLRKIDTPIKIEKTVPELTIEDVKNTIAFPSGSGLNESLSMMVDCWYKIALNEGKTKEQAALYALDKLSEELLKW